MMELGALIYSHRLVVGDWSKDGHAESTDYYIKCNVEQHWLPELYKAGTKILGFDLTQLCERYEHHTLTAEQYNILLEKGLMSCKQMDEQTRFCLTYTERDRESDESFCIEPQSYVFIYLFICLLADPAFNWQFEDERTKFIPIGGYGLFYN